jgi:hypothetical protein
MRGGVWRFEEGYPQMTLGLLMDQDRKVRAMAARALKRC